MCGSSRTWLSCGHTFGARADTHDRLHEEEPQRRDVETDGQRAHLPLAQEIRPVRPKMCLIQPVGPTLEQSGESLDRVEIGQDRRGGEVTRWSSSSITCRQQCLGAGYRLSWRAKRPW
jgi:hypothetical protein